MNIVDFFSNNYQWIFSGIGVVILVAILNFFRKTILLKKQKEKQPAVVLNTIVIKEDNPIEESVEASFLEIAPDEICEKKKHLSEIDFQTYFSSFNDHTIAWEGEIATVSLDKKNNKNVRIQMVFANDRIRVFFSILIDDFPNIKLFKSGDIVKVKGKISSPDWPTMNLIDVEILGWRTTKM